MEILDIICKEWKYRNLKRVRINMPNMDRAWYKVHICMQNGLIFGIQSEYKTKTGIVGYELCGAVGKTIPFRNKILARWTAPVSRLEYWKERYFSG